MTVPPRDATYEAAQVRDARAETIRKLTAKGE